MNELSYGDNIPLEQILTTTKTAKFAYLSQTTCIFFYTFMYST